MILYTSQVLVTMPFVFSTATSMQRGFTLIETMIYLAIFTVMIGGIVMAAYALFASSAKLETRAMILQEEQFAMMTIERLLSEAASVSVPTSGSQGGTLTLTTFSGVTYMISRASGVITLNGSALTNTNVTADTLTFQRASTTPDGVTADFTLSAKSPQGTTVTVSASTTKYLRK